MFIINKFLSIQMRILYSALLEVVGWHIKLKTQYYVKVKDRKRIEYRHIKGLKQPHHRVDTCNWKHNMVIWILNWIKSDDETYPYHREINALLPIFFVFLSFVFLSFKICKPAQSFFPLSCSPSNRRKHPRRRRQTWNPRRNPLID